MSILSYCIKGVAYYVATTLSMFALSTVIPQASFVARLLAAYASLIICASYGVVASIVLRIVGYQRISQYVTARSFKWIMRFTTGVCFDIVEGEQYLSTRPAVFIGNHQTELDVLMLGHIFPPYCSVTAKKSLGNVPFLGWFMTLSGTVFIDRANRETAVKAFDGAATEMKVHRQSVYIFPEGTRSYATKPELLPFKKGAFHLAIKAGVPIVPLVVENYSHILNIRALRFNSGTIQIKGMVPSHPGLPGQFISLKLFTHDQHSMMKLTDVSPISSSTDRDEKHDHRGCRGPDHQDTRPNAAGFEGLP
jgi:lysophosphatidate acyltransferase